VGPWAPARCADERPVRNLPLLNPRALAPRGKHTSAKGSPRSDVCYSLHPLSQKRKTAWGPLVWVPRLFSASVTKGEDCNTHMEVGRTRCRDMFVLQCAGWGGAVFGRFLCQPTALRPVSQSSFRIYIFGTSFE